jgi:hypothetical protein
MTIVAGLATSGDIAKLTEHKLADLPGELSSLFSQLPCTECSYNFYKAVRFIFRQVDGTDAQKSAASHLKACSADEVDWSSELITRGLLHTAVELKKLLCLPDVDDGLKPAVIGLQVVGTTASRPVTSSASHLGMSCLGLITVAATGFFLFLSE